MTDRITYTDSELLYAATARCRCGAGLAYPLDHDAAFKVGAWQCSGVLRGDVRGEAEHGKHDSYPWAFYKIREETSINNHGGASTRPPGTVAKTVGKATCPKCRHKWESEPYVAGTVSHHWFSGACPGCGYAVGGGASHRSDEGPAIETGYPDIVVTT